jgi:hypothetical protein
VLWYFVRIVVDEEVQKDIELVLRIPVAGKGKNL